MTRLWLVRHGRATAGWDVDPDPDLDDQGREQAFRVAHRLATEARGAAVFTSPLTRCRTTADTIGQYVHATPVVCDEISEIPSPPGVALASRMQWLRDAMSGTWSDLGEPYVTYRDGLVRFVRDCKVDAVMVSHFIAINAVLGALAGDDRLVVRHLDNCSVTLLERDSDGALRVVEGGSEAETLIR